MPSGWFWYVLRSGGYRMAKHEFGIMENAPKPCQRFDDYEPEKYRHIVSVPDACIEPLLTELQSIRTFSHTLGRPACGLEYCGVTLIPPQALPAMTAILESRKIPAYHELIALLRQAEEKQCWVIHFGL